MKEIQVLHIDCERHISYRFTGFEYDDIEIRVLHPEFEYQFEIDRTSTDIETTRDLFEYVIRHLVIDHGKVIYTKLL